MTNQLKDMLIGLFVVIACLIIVAIVLVIKPNIGDGKQIVHVYFNSVAGISDGTQVTLAGKQIGEVSSIQQVPNARQKQVGPDGTVYYYYVTLKVDSSAVLYPSDEFCIATLGLLGEKVVAIIPKPSPTGKILTPITSSDVVYADSADLFESTVNEFSQLAEKFEETLDIINGWIQKYGDTIGNTIHDIDLATQEVTKSLAEINKIGLIQDIQEGVRSFAAFSSAGAVALSQLNQEEFFINLSHIAVNLNQSTTSIAEGKGFIGRLIEEDDLYLEIEALICKAINLMNSVNRYGVLFQYNKEWQRTNRQNCKQTKELQDPKVFSSKVGADMKELNDSFSTIKNLSGRMTNEELASSPLFKKKFAAFISALNDLERQIKLYNQELIQLSKKPEMAVEAGSMEE